MPRIVSARSTLPKLINLLTQLLYSTRASSSAPAVLAAIPLSSSSPSAVYHINETLAIITLIKTKLVSTRRHTTQTATHLDHPSDIISSTSTPRPPSHVLLYRSPPPRHQDRTTKDRVTVTSSCSSTLRDESEGDGDVSCLGWLREQYLSYNSPPSTLRPLRHLLRRHHRPCLAVNPCPHETKTVRTNLTPIHFRPRSLALSDETGCWRWNWGMGIRVRLSFTHPSSNVLRLRPLDRHSPHLIPHPSPSSSCVTVSTLRTIVPSTVARCNNDINISTQEPEHEPEEWDWVSPSTVLPVISLIAIAIDTCPPAADSATATGLLSLLPLFTKKRGIKKKKSGIKKTKRVIKKKKKKKKTRCLVPKSLSPTS
ncbi:hypothetical protein SISSUDRAFT_1067689 [Sistotremastrum suecicum HHB10207 ss-3]|uniref:Uncharacterized protein n=1 Tax=Sistotremastrum suecicum HHB10207 ss-3 TaxID=1314776 RepID=A0A165WU31_9AGAM|nr:hypothetical protein SISSUDRAFT_1067689 [Sistotremastrum suecicum HHB10207 ss-3]